MICMRQTPSYRIFLTQIPEKRKKVLDIREKYLLNPAIIEI